MQLTVASVIKLQVERDEKIKSTLRMIIASVMNIAGRYKGRVIIGHEHCLSHLKTRKRCKLRKGSHDHCMKH